MKGKYQKHQALMMQKHQIASNHQSSKYLPFYIHHHEWMDLWGKNRVIHVYLYIFNSKATLVRISINCTHLWSPFIKHAYRSFCMFTVDVHVIYLWMRFIRFCLSLRMCIYFSILLTRHIREKCVFGKIVSMLRENPQSISFAQCNFSWFNSMVYFILQP